MSVEGAAQALPPIIRAAWVNRTQAEAFEVFTTEIGAWWPLPSHGLFGHKSGTVFFRDLKLIEQATDGSEVVWGEVLAWEEPQRVVLAWHPGRDVDEASQVDISFEVHGGGTRVIIEHHGWEAFGPDAMARRRGYVGPGAWGYVLDHYSDGAEPRPDAPELTDLTAGYDAFFAEAERGGFGPAPADAWDAAQVIAHVALNDAAMLNVCQALVHQNPARFENNVCQDLDVLARYITAAQGFDTLIERGRHMSTLVLAALSRLSPEQRATEVHCCLTHDGETMVDRPMPWQAVAISTQAAMHLPAHIAQLRNLRA